MELRGLLCAFAAATAFGVQYAPVKRYEIFDGATFQWFMCSGILMVGFVVAMLTGQLERGCPSLVVLGGALWALSNCFVLPLVKLLGMGVGFSLYHFVNLVVGYAVGRFGLFGVPQMPGDLTLCDLGCGLILTSFVVMVFVEVDGEGRERRTDAVTLQRSISAFGEVDLAGAGLELGHPLAECRAIYRHWRLAGMGLSTPPGLRALLSSPVGHLAGTGESAQYRRTVSAHSSPLQVSPHLDIAATAPKLPVLPGGDSPYCPPVRSDAAPSAEAERHDPAVPSGGVRFQGSASRSFEPTSPPAPLTVPTPEPSLQGVGSSWQGEHRRAGLTDSPRLGYSRRLIGVGLAIAGGGFCGVQSVPATLFNQAHPDASPIYVVFPQCLGIWAASSAIYLLYAVAGKVLGRRVPHSAIRPAYSSGVIWGVGFSLMIVGIRDLGYSVGYSLDAAGPIMVSSLLSWLVFGEIKGRLQMTLYSVGFALQLVGVILIASYGSP